jgi:hypothetical protein
MAIPCKEEQQRRAARKMCNRVRSVLTHLVKHQTAITLEKRKAFLWAISGQSPFLGSCQSRSKRSVSKLIVNAKTSRRRVTRRRVKLGSLCVSGGLLARCRSELARDCVRGHADNREQARSYN